MLRHLINIWEIAMRERKILMKNPIYLFCMVIFPVLTLFFFTTLLDEGVPQEMPVGVVDLDNSSTSRALVRRLDGFQTSNVVANFASVAWTILVRCRAVMPCRRTRSMDSCISQREHQRNFSQPVGQRCLFIIVMCRLLPALW